MAITNATRVADFGSGIGTEGAVLQVDNTNNRLGVGTTNPQAMLQVGTGVSVYGNSGIVSATSFYGDGANLTNVGMDTGVVVSDQVFVVGVATVGSAVTINSTGIDAVSGIITSASAIVGSAVTINSTGIDAVSGVITASSFVGNGAGLTGVASTDNIITGVAVTIGGILRVTDTTQSTSSTTGSVIISGGVGIAKTLTVGGNISVGGTLTYEDVTNVDSVGLITARSGIQFGVAGVGGTITGVGNAILSGITTIGVGLTLGDSIQARFGDAGDLKVYHNGSHSYIQDEGTGSLYIDSNQLYLRNADTDNVLLYTTSGGAVRINHNGTQKMETSSTGINPSADSTDDLGTSAIRWRNIYGDTLYGDGSNLTGISAGGLTTAASTISGIVTTLLLSSAQDHKVTATGFCTITCSGGTEGESHSVRIINSGIATVGFSTYFLFPSGNTPVLPTADTSISLISFTVNRVGLGGTQLLAGASLNFS
jgi:hypothetical protein